MKLRFAVNQAECLRRGIDAPKSIVTIEVTPAEIPPGLRNLIAKRMEGIDICILNPDGSFQKKLQRIEESGGAYNLQCLIKANEPTMEGLLVALMKNEAELDALTTEHKEMMNECAAVIEAGGDLQALFKQFLDDVERSKIPSVAVGPFCGSDAQLSPRPEWKPGRAK